MPEYFTRHFIFFLNRYPPERHHTIEYDWKARGWSGSTASGMAIIIFTSRYLCQGRPVSEYVGCFTCGVVIHKCFSWVSGVLRWNRRRWWQRMPKWKRILLGQLRASRMQPEVSSMHLLILNVHTIDKATLIYSNIISILKIYNFTPSWMQCTIPDTIVEICSGSFWIMIIRTDLNISGKKKNGEKKEKKGFTITGFFAYYCRDNSCDFFFL